MFRNLFKFAIALTICWTSQVLGFKGSRNETKWLQYKHHYGKFYASQLVDGNRHGIWESNMQKIRVHNEEAALGKYSYTLGENDLSDLSSKEYRSMLNYRSIRRDRLDRSGTEIRIPLYKLTVNVSSLPTCVNWTDYEWVGPVKDQGKCGSCWSYAAVGALEAQYFNNTEQFLQLSEQNLIDCSSEQGNNGCDGGNMHYAYWYVQTNGIQALSTYPETSATTGSSSDPCTFDSSKSVMSVNSWRAVAEYDEEALQQAVALVGPVSVGIDANATDFQLYKSGIYTSSTCSSTEINHAVLVVGYGVYAGQEYWLLRNSYGTRWGMNGYMMLARNSGNKCGIATDASFPLMEAIWSKQPVHPASTCPPLSTSPPPSTTTPRQYTSGCSRTLHAASIACTLYVSCVFLAALL